MNIRSAAGETETPQNRSDDNLNCRYEPSVVLAALILACMNHLSQLCGYALQDGFDSGAAFAATAVAGRPGTPINAHGVE
jgi:hypothetical protein